MLRSSGVSGLASWVSACVPDRAGEPGLAPAGELGVGLCARQRTHFSCFAKKSKQKKASRIRRPCGHAALLSCGGVRANSARASNMRAPSSAAACATRLLITAEQTKDQYQTPQGRAMTRPCLTSGCYVINAVMRRRVAQGRTDQGWRCLSAASLARPRLRRATQLTRATRGATNPARLLFGDFLLATHEKVTALSGAPPDLLDKKNN